MRYAPRALVAGGLGFAVSCLVACGSGGAGLLSGDQSSSLNSQLDSISAAVNSGNCGGATQAVATFARTVTNLPVTVSLTLRRNLLQGASTVGVLAQRDCSTSSTSPSTSTTPPKTTTTTTTTTPSTSTHTSTSTSTATTTTTTTTPPSTTPPPATSTTAPGTTTTGGTGGAGIGGGDSGGGGDGNNGNGGNGT